MRFQVPSLRHVRGFAPHCRPRWELMRQGTPLASRAVQVQNGVDDFSHVGGTGVSSRLGGWDQRRKDGPFSLTEIAWIVFSLHRSTSFPFCWFDTLFLFSSPILSRSWLPCRIPSQASLLASPSFIWLLRPLHTASKIAAKRFIHIQKLRDESSAF